MQKSLNILLIIYLLFMNHPNNSINANILNSIY